MTLIDWVLVIVWAGIALSGFWKGAVRIVFDCSDKLSSRICISHVMQQSETSFHVTTRCLVAGYR